MRAVLPRGTDPSGIATKKFRSLLGEPGYGEKLQQIIRVSHRAMLRCGAEANSLNLRAPERIRSRGCHRRRLRLGWGTGVAQGGASWFCTLRPKPAPVLPHTARTIAPNARRRCSHPVGRSISANAVSGTHGRATPAATSSKPRYSFLHLKRPPRRGAQDRRVSGH